MILFTRWMSRFVLAIYLGLVSLQAFHSHTTILEARDNCQICQIAHQTPTLVNPPDAPAFVLSSAFSKFTFVPHPYLRFVFQSHGLAPPVL